MQYSADLCSTVQTSCYQEATPLLTASWLSFREPLPPSLSVFVIPAALPSALPCCVELLELACSELMVKHSGTLQARHLEISHGGSTYTKEVDKCYKKRPLKFFFYSQFTSAWLPQLHKEDVLQTDQSAPRIPQAGAIIIRHGTWPNQSHSEATEHLFT